MGQLVYTKMGMKYSQEVLDNMGKWIESQNQILEQEMLAAKAKEMQIEMDREILWGMLEGMGWRRVMVSRFQDNTHAIDITMWLEENVKNPFERNGRDFLFENEKDAVNFILRWV
jgi:hypothetical protein